MPDPLEAHYKMVTKAIVDGRVVPFLGAGVNLCGRLAGVAWQRGRSRHLPSGAELAAYLAENFGYPPSETQVPCPSCKSSLRLAEQIKDLVRVSQYVAVKSGSGPLYEELHALFAADYPPTLLHEFFATLPAVLHRRGQPPRHQLIVTTNYDDLMENALRAAGEPFDVVTYLAEGEMRGKFSHWSEDGGLQLIDAANQYASLPIEMPSLRLKRSVVLKIHGTVDRLDAERDSYVITEDHYIDYLSRTDISNLMPSTLVAKLKKSHFLFLGYSLRDWNLRVILHRIWREQKLDYKSWAIQLSPEPIDQEFWRKRDVDILDVPLERYVAALSERLGTQPPGGASA